MSKINKLIIAAAGAGKTTYLINEALKQKIPINWESGVLSDLGKIVGGSTPSKQNQDNFSQKGIAWIKQS